MRKSILIFKLKVMEYFSSIRRTKYAFILLIFILYGLVSFGFAMGNLSSEYLQGIQNYTTAPQGYIDPEVFTRLSLLEFFISILLSFAFLVTIILSIRTAFTATEADCDFVFTSPITFKEYAFAEILYQTLIGNFTFAVFIAYLVMITNVPIIGVGIWNLPIALVIFELLIVMMIIFGQILSILYLRYRRIAVIIVAILILVTILPPILKLYLHVPISSESIPYPPYIMSRIIFSNYDILDIIIFLLYLVIAFAIWNKIVNRNYFVEIKPVTIGVFGGISERRLRPTLVIRFGFIKRIFTIDVSGSILKAHISKEFTRIVRDGSLFTALGMNLIYGAILYFMFAGFQCEGDMPETFGLIFSLSMALFFTLFSPLTHIEKWRLNERKYLWVILSSYTDPNEYVKGLIFSSMMASIITPAILLVVLVLYLPPTYLLIGFMSIVTLALVVTEITYSLEFRFGKPTYETFSIDYLIIIFGAYIISSILISPNAILIWLPIIFTNVKIEFLIPIVIIYDVIIIYLGYKFAIRQFKKIKVIG